MGSDYKINLQKDNVDEAIPFTKGKIDEHIEHLDIDICPTYMCVSIWTNENIYHVLGQGYLMSYRV